MRNNFTVQNNFFKTTFLFAGMFFFIGATSANAQGIFGKIKEQVKKEAKIPDSSGNNTNLPGTKILYRWARIETRLSWNEAGRTKYETRAYYTNLNKIVFTKYDSKMQENLQQYFEDGIVKSLKEKGFEVKYYDSDISLLPYDYEYETSEEGEKEIEKRMEADKSNEYSIYTFVWKYNAKATAEMTNPKRIFSVKPVPSIE